VNGAKAWPSTELPTRPSSSMSWPSISLRRWTSPRYAGHPDS